MKDILKTVPLFKHLSALHLSHIENACTIKNYKAGTVLFRENEVGTVFYVILTGLIKIYTTNHDGEEKILSLLSAGESFGELSLIDGKPRSATAQAIEDTQVLSLLSRDFNMLLQMNSDIALSVIKELCARLRDTNQQVHDLLFLDAKQRVVKILAQLALKQGTRDGSLVHINVKLNFSDISQMAGVSRDVMMSVFRDLQEKQILTISQSRYSIDLSKIGKQPSPSRF